MNEATQVYEDATALTDEEAAAVWAATPPVTAPGMTAHMDGAGNVTLEATLTPTDRAVLRDVARDQAISHAEKIGSPQGLRGLFPTNHTRLVARRLKDPIRRPAR